MGDISPWKKTNCSKVSLQISPSVGGNCSGSAKLHHLYPPALGSTPPVRGLPWGTPATAAWGCSWKSRIFKSFFLGCLWICPHPYPQTFDFLLLLSTMKWFKAELLQKVFLHLLFLHLVREEEEKLRVESEIQLELESAWFQPLKPSRMEWTPNCRFSKMETLELEVDPKQWVGFRALKTEQFVLKDGCLLHEEIKKDNFYYIFTFKGAGDFANWVGVFYPSFKGKGEK